MINTIKKRASAWRKAQKFKSFYRQFIKPGDLCFDIGANIGKRTAIFLELRARVVAVEPGEAAYALLSKSFKDTPSVTLLPLAVGKKKGVETLYISNVSEVCTLSQAFIEQYKGQPKYNIEWSRSQQVPVTTLDHLIETYGLPSFCKIDVEGYEAEVLQGLSQVLPAMSLEYNNKLKQSALECLEILSKFDGLTYNFSPYEKMKYSLKTWKPQTEFYEFIKKLPMEIKTGDIYVKS